MKLYIFYEQVYISPCSNRSHNKKIPCHNSQHVSFLAYYLRFHSRPHQNQGQKKKNLTHCTTTWHIFGTVFYSSKKIAALHQFWGKKNFFIVFVVLYLENIEIKVMKIIIDSTKVKSTTVQGVIRNSIVLLLDYLRHY